METLPPGGSVYFALRLQDDQPKFNIVAVASELGHFQTRDAALRVLFDWSQVQNWPFEAPTAASIRAWNNTAPLIARAAFVHCPKWNRHVAILAALMRVGNAQVRSFHPPDYDKAIIWLKQDPITLAFDGNMRRLDQEDDLDI
jgi:hypothetical protein